MASGTSSETDNVHADVVEFYDLKGLNCPLPALRTRKRLARMMPGEQLRVETTDPLAAIDIAAMCNDEGHVLLSTKAQASSHSFLIERGDATPARAG